MKVSLALALAEDKGGKCFTESHMRYHYIQIFRNKTQKSEKPSGIALKRKRIIWISKMLKNGLNVLSCSQPLGFTFYVSYI